MAPLSRLAALLLAGPAAASLRDLAACDPFRKDSHCPPDPAFAGPAAFDFAPGADVAAFWLVDNDTARALVPDAPGALDMARGTAPTLISRRYLLFGRVSATLRAARGPGLVTALVLKSDSGDEIDWELLGAFDHQASSNYFYDGKALYNTYNDTYPLAQSAADAFHTYAVEWSDRALSFAIDGRVRKTWRRGDIPPGAWPQTPMRVKLGVWAVANDSDPGTVAWAGGLPDWEHGPFRAVFRSVRVDDFTGGCTELAGDDVDVEYRYDERSTGWRDVAVDGCKERPAGDMATPTRTAAPTPTASEPEHSGSAGGGGGGGGDDDGAAALWLSSPLAALVCLGWLLVL